MLSRPKLWRLLRWNTHFWQPSMQHFFCHKRSHLVLTRVKTPWWAQLLSSENKPFGNSTLTTLTTFFLLILITIVNKLFNLSGTRLHDKSISPGAQGSCHFNKFNYFYYLGSKPHLGRKISSCAKMSLMVFTKQVFCCYHGVYDMKARGIVCKAVIFIV